MLAYIFLRLRFALPHMPCHCYLPRSFCGIVEYCPSAPCSKYSISDLVLQFPTALGIGDSDKHHRERRHGSDVLLEAWQPYSAKRIHCLGALSEDRVPTDRICVHRITLHGTLCTCVDPMQRLAYTCASGLTGKDTGCLPVYEKVYRMLRAEYPN